MQLLTLSFGIFNDKFEHVFASRDPCNKTFSYCQLSAQYRGVFRKLSDIYVPYTDTPGSWFLLAKCLKNTCWGATFQVFSQNKNRADVVGIQRLKNHLMRNC